MTLRDACAWMVPYRDPTPWLQVMREMREMRKRLRAASTIGGLPPMKTAAQPDLIARLDAWQADQPVPLLDDDGRPVTVRGEVWYPPARGGRVTRTKVEEAMLLFRELDSTDLCILSLKLDYEKPMIKTIRGSVTVRRDSVLPVLEAHRDWLAAQLNELGIEMARGDKL